MLIPLSLYPSSLALTCVSAVSWASNVRAPHGACTVTCDTYAVGESLIPMSRRSTGPCSPVGR